jgi:hypothetical protein
VATRSASSGTTDRFFFSRHISAQVLVTARRTESAWRLFAFFNAVILPPANQKRKLKSDLI